MKTKNEKKMERRAKQKGKKNEHKRKDTKTRIK